MGLCCSREDKLKENLAMEGGDSSCRVGAGGVRIRVEGSCTVASMYTQQGRKGINQDAMTIWEDFVGKKERIFCGVFDGHGPYGHKVARHVRDSLPLKITSNCHSETFMGDDANSDSTDSSGNGGDEFSREFSSWSSILSQSFKEMDMELNLHPSIDCFCSGTTAVTIVKQNEHLVIANLGDSRAILCSRNDRDDLIPVQLTVDLKPNLPNEAERIMQCKGRVFALEEEPDVHRLWLPDENCPGLAMARAFGDFCLKDFGLISIPEISYRRIQEKDEFIVLATDGVWDVLSNMEVIKIVSSARNRSMAAKAVVDKAVRAWKYKYPTSKIDDCAVICLFLKVVPPNPVKAEVAEDENDGSEISRVPNGDAGGTSLRVPCEASQDENSDAGGTSLRLPCEASQVTSGDAGGTSIRLPCEANQVTSGDAGGSSIRLPCEANVSESPRQAWHALDGVTRSNSLVKLPRLQFGSRKKRE